MVWDVEGRVYFADVILAKAAVERPVVVEECDSATGLEFDNVGGDFVDVAGNVVAGVGSVRFGEPGGEFPVFWVCAD
jgi:hypothetical protein